LTSKNRAGEFHVPMGGINIVPDLEVLQLWCWSRESCQHALQVLDIRAYLELPETMEVVERGGKEGFHVVFAPEELVDVEELLLGSAEETFCLFRIGS